MSRQSRKSAYDPREPTLFGPPEQPDLFGSPEPARYAPKPEHVRSGLRKLVETLAAAETWWGWTDYDIERYRQRDIAYYCDLLPDAAEREEWHARLMVEVARIDAASGSTRPYDPQFDPGGKALRAMNR
ncbi:MAG: hypothetical protein ACLPN5_23010 [Roseiarcus sp.]